jgi:hypothetical protein
LLSGGNTTYKTPESEFIANNVAVTSCDTFDLLGAGIRPGMGSTTMPEEKRNVTVTFHIYKMDSNGDYIEYTSSQYENIRMIVIQEDTHGFDYSHGGMTDNSITGKVDWNTQPDTAYLSVRLIEEIPGENSAFLFGNFDVKLKLRANHEPEFGTV